MGGLSFYEDESGNKYVVGADAVPKKLGKSDQNGSIMLASVGSGPKYASCVGFNVDDYTKVKWEGINVKNSANFSIMSDPVTILQTSTQSSGEFDLSPYTGLIYFRLWSNAMSDTCNFSLS